MSTAGAVFADKTGFSAGAYIISLTLSQMLGFGLH